MQTDELRAELTDLANEVEPFTGDVSAVRRRVARRRTVVGSVAIVVIAAVTVGAVAFTRAKPNRVNVAHSVKEVGLAQLPRFDAAVVLPVDATPADVARVRETLTGTAAVEEYSALSTIVLVRALQNTVPASAKSLRARVCAAPSTPSFAVELSRAVPDALAQLAAAVGANVALQPIGLPNVDIEVFMQVHASQAETAAVQTALTQDPDVAKITYLDHQAAFDEFRKLYADQPDLVANETPAGLPESFRVEMRDGVSLDQMSKRFGRLPGVDQTIIPREGLDLDTRPNIPTGQANLFMKVDASNAEIADLRATMKIDPIVQSYLSVDRVGYEQFVKLLRGERDGTEMLTSNFDRRDIPTSFRIMLRSQDDAFSFVGAYQATPGLEFLVISHDPLREACIQSAPESGTGGTTPATTAPAP